MIRFARGRCTIVAEVGLSHDGSLGLAHAFVEAVARAGADAVKFQTHIASAESTAQEPWRTAFSRQDSSRYDYWSRTAFSEEQWRGLADHARTLGLGFLSSPFSIEAVDLLENVGVDAWKIGSGEVPNLPLLDRVAGTGLPILLSSGMSSMSELDGAIERLSSRGAEVAILQCTSGYPCPPEKVGLNMLQIFRDRYPGLAVGLSDHSGTIFPGLAAVTLGIEVLEVHVTLSREMFGPDVSSSVRTKELSQLVTGTRFIETMMSNPVDKDAMAAGLTEMREIFGRSIVTRSALPAGTLLATEHLTLKKPGIGMPPDKLDAIVGRRLARPLDIDAFIREEDLA